MFDPQSQRAVGCFAIAQRSLFIYWGQLAAMTGLRRLGDDSATTQRCHVALRWPLGRKRGASWRGELPSVGRHRDGRDDAEPVRHQPPGGGSVRGLHLHRGPQRGGALAKGAQP
eukprot:1181118-Prorocentrum_minimum.AAC.2